MGVARCFVVSDLHLGSAYFYHRHFFSWLDTLPQGVPLILNGDVIDRRAKPCPTPIEPCWSASCASRNPGP